LDAEAAQLAANSLRKLGSCPSFVWIYGDFLAMKQDSERDMQDDTDGFLWLTMASWSMSRFFLHWHGMAVWREERVLNITYYPLAVFRVRPVTRCTSSLSGHIEAWGSEKKIWTNIWTTLDNDIQRSWKICIYIYMCVYIYNIYNCGSG
jgi:hypothetical protein